MLQAGRGCPSHVLPTLRLTGPWRGTRGRNEPLRCLLPDPPPREPRTGGASAGGSMVLAQQALPFTPARSLLAATSFLFPRSKADPRLLDTWLSLLETFPPCPMPSTPSHPG